MRSSSGSSTVFASQQRQNEGPKREKKEFHHILWRSWSGPVSGKHQADGKIKRVGRSDSFFHSPSTCSRSEMALCIFPFTFEGMLALWYFPYDNWTLVYTSFCWVPVILHFHWGKISFLAFFPDENWSLVHVSQLNATNISFGQLLCFKKWIDTL